MNKKTHNENTNIHTELKVCIHKHILEGLIGDYKIMLLLLILVSTLYFTFYLY